MAELGAVGMVESVESQVARGIAELHRRVTSGENRNGFIPKPKEKSTGKVVLRKWVSEGVYENFEVDFLMARIGHLRRRVHAWAECFRDVSVKFIMVGITYKNQSFFKLRDITDFIRRLKRRRKIYGYCWVHEMQNRPDGSKVSHYHVIVAVKPGTRLPMPDKSGYWLKGSSSVTWARTPFYICSYTGKVEQKEGLPDYAHMYAAWVSPEIYKSLGSFLRENYRRSLYPCWLVEILNNRGDWMVEGVDVSRVRSGGGGGWWVDGMLFKSPYEFMLS